MVSSQDLVPFLGSAFGGFLSGYVLRILVVDYENEIETRRRIDEEVYGSIYTMLDELSRGWIMGDDDIEAFEDEWQSLLSDKSHLIDEEVKEDVDDFVAGLWSKKEEFDEREQKKADCVAGRADHHQNVIYYPAMKELLPEFMQSNSEEELHKNLIDRYNRTDDEDLKDTIERLEINNSRIRWSEKDWDEIQRRYGENLTYYDRENNPYKYHHNYMNHLFYQHKLCNSIRDEISELQAEMERRRGKSNRFAAIKAIFT